MQILNLPWSDRLYRKSIKRLLWQYCIEQNWLISLGWEALYNKNYSSTILTDMRKAIIPVNSRTPNLDFRKNAMLKSITNYATEQSYNKGTCSRYLQIIRFLENHGAGIIEPSLKWHKVLTVVYIS